MTSTDQHNLPVVQAIVVTWNKRADVIRLLADLERIDYPAGRLFVLVVDNASTDGTADRISAAFPGVDLLRNPRNLGGAGGFNAGMRWALAHRPEARYLWLLDNDVRVSAAALSQLVQALEHHPEAAICGSTIVDIDRPETVIEAGAFIDYRIGDVRPNVPSRGGEADRGDVAAVDYVAACSLLARMELVRRYGIWHEKLFIYWDDMEWGARFRRNGYAVLASRSSIVYHPSWKERSADQSAVWRSYYRARNSLWFFNNYVQAGRKALLLRMMLRFSRWSLGTATRTYTALSRAYLAGMMDFLNGVYGQKSWQAPETDIDRYGKSTGGLRICLFFPFLEEARAAEAVCSAIGKRIPAGSIGIFSDRSAAPDRRVASLDAVYLVRKTERFRISWQERLRMMRFLHCHKWDLMVTDQAVARMAAVFGKPVARLSIPDGTILAIERLSMLQLARVVATAIRALFRAVFRLPSPEENAAYPS